MLVPQCYLCAKDAPWVLERGDKGCGGDVVILNASIINLYLIPPGQTAEWRRQRTCTQQVCTRQIIT